MEGLCVSSFPSHSTTGNAAPLGGGGALLSNRWGMSSVVHHVSLLEKLERVKASQ